jgi:hypothetical protein
MKKIAPNRISRVAARLRPKEREQVEEAALRVQVTLSELVRAAVLDYSRRILTPWPGADK